MSFRWTALCRCLRSSSTQILCVVLIASLFPFPGSAQTYPVYGFCQCLIEPCNTTATLAGGPYEAMEQHMLKAFRGAHGPRVRGNGESLVRLPSMFTFHEMHYYTSTGECGKRIRNDCVEKTCGTNLAGFLSGVEALSTALAGPAPMFPNFYNVEAYFSCFDWNSRTVSYAAHSAVSSRPFGKTPAGEASRAAQSSARREHPILETTARNLPAIAAVTLAAVMMRLSIAKNGGLGTAALLPPAMAMPWDEQVTWTILAMKVMRIHELLTVINGQETTIRQVRADPDNPGVVNWIVKYGRHTYDFFDDGHWMDADRMSLMRLPGIPDRSAADYQSIG